MLSRFDVGILLKSEHCSRKVKPYERFIKIETNYAYCCVDEVMQVFSLGRFNSFSQLGTHLLHYRLVDEIN